MIAGNATVGVMPRTMPAARRSRNGCIAPEANDPATLKWLPAASIGGRRTSLFPSGTAEVAIEFVGQPFRIHRRRRERQIARAVGMARHPSVGGSTRGQPESRASLGASATAWRTGGDGSHDRHDRETVQIAHVSRRWYWTIAASTRRAILSTRQPRLEPLVSLRTRRRTWLLLGR